MVADAVQVARAEQEQVEVAKREQEPAEEAVREGAPPAPREQQFHVLDEEDEQGAGRAGAPSFRNHVQIFCLRRMV